MSKEKGQRIVVKFDSELLGDVRGFEPNPLGGFVDSKMSGLVISSNVNPTYGNGINSIMDGSTSTYCGTISALPNVFDFRQYDRYVVYKIRVYSGASYRINQFSFQGSVNGVDWIDLVVSNLTNATGWSEFVFENDVAYTFFRFNAISRYSTRTYLYEIEIYGKYPIGQERAFSVTGEEFSFVDGPSNNGQLVEKIYQVSLVERHPTLENSIVLIMNDLSRFNNVVGSLNVLYDKSLGSLVGFGGEVDPFSVNFAPSELLAKPNVANRESINVLPVFAIYMPIIDYKKRYADDNVKVDVSIGLVLTYVGIINP